jgi:hypothetical protein
MVEKFKFYAIAIIITSLLITCSPPGPNPTLKVYDEGYPGAYINILQNKIYGVSVYMEYSLDDRVGWTSCPGGVVDVNFEVGNKVWVRTSGDPGSEIFLGEVKALSGGSDLIMLKDVLITDSGYNIRYYGYQGQSRVCLFKVTNIGDSAGQSSNHEIHVYLSTDKIISASDTLLAQTSFGVSCPEGTIPAGSSYYTIPFTVPVVATGTYYIGCILDATDAIAELNDDYNMTFSNRVAEFRITDSSAQAAGAFKFINSWGTSGSWENIHDGHYWVTYDTMKQQQMLICYYYNNFSQIYEPTVVAVFQLSSNNLYRDECKITVGLGNADSPYMFKELQTRSSSSLKSGHYYFPNNKIIMDISEFAPYINDYHTFLKIENSGSASGTLTHFSIEYYEDYDGSPFKTLSGDTGAVAGNKTSTFIADTEDYLSIVELQNIVPLTRSSSAGVRFIEEYPSEQELLHDMQRVGVCEEGKNYNYLYLGKYGTGLKPPTMAEWRMMKKLRRIETSFGRNLMAWPEEIDHSISPYFPPIGNQGSEGSCASFAVGYYVQTYTEAKEHGWDLSGASWIGSPGAPDAAHQGYIFSPDFIYHQINSGVDKGSSNIDAGSLVVRLGGATWLAMPYDDNDSTTWPNESAFRQSGRYRGREVQTYITDYYCSGYFIINTDADIDLLKTLLNEGYCVVTGINAADDPANPDDNTTLYSQLDIHDVVDDDSTPPQPVDHAQTIVGYKEGGEWNPVDPDS